MVRTQAHFWKEMNFVENMHETDTIKYQRTTIPDTTSYGNFIAFTFHIATMNCVNAPHSIEQPQDSCLLSCSEKQTIRKEENRVSVIATIPYIYTRQDWKQQASKKERHTISCSNVLVSFIFHYQHHEPTTTSTIQPKVFAPLIKWFIEVESKLS